MVPAVAEKSAEVDPACTVTEVGTVRLVLSSERATTLPLAGATFERVTVQVVLAFAVKAIAVHWTDERATGAISERVAVLETPAREAVMVALRSDVMLRVVAEKSAEVAPACTMTEVGTVRLALSSERATTLPLAGATFERVTVQVVLAF